MVYDVNALLNHINRIRKEIGHEEVSIDIKEVLYDKDTNEMWIITNDRPDKSAIIGKGGWVVGRLREELEIASIHVESYSDFLQKEYRMNLSLSKLNLGYMAPTNSKGTKTVETVKLYGDYDYINFYINSKKKNTYFAYEIFSDKDCTKLVEGDVVACNKGTYSFTPKIKLKGNYKTKTYYMVTYAAKIFDELTGVLGLVYNRKTETLDEDIDAMIVARTEARKNKNWAEADRIRDELKAMGIVLEDTAQGVKWHRE